MNTNFPYHVHSSAPLVPVMSQKNPVQNTTYRFLKIHFDIIFPSTPRYSKLCLSVRFSFHTILFFPTSVRCSAHLSFLDLITLMRGSGLKTKSAKLISRFASEYKSKCVLSAVAGNGSTKWCHSKCALSAVAANDSTKWCHSIHPPLNVN